MQNKKEVHMVYPCPFCGEIPNQPDDWLTVICRTKRCPMRAKPVKLNNWNKQHCRQINPNQRAAAGTLRKRPAQHTTAAVCNTAGH
jgi:hypothetical protein